MAAKKEQVMLVVDITDESGAPRRIASVSFMTLKEGIKLRKIINQQDQAGRLRGCYMAPVEAIRRTFKETAALLEVKRA